MVQGRSIGGLRGPLMRIVAFTAGVLAIACATPVVAGEAVSGQVALKDPWAAARERPTNVSDLLTQLNGDHDFAEIDGRDLGRTAGWSGYAADKTSPWAVSNSDVWFAGGDYSDRM